jgi:hypothetical protein
MDELGAWTFTNPDMVEKLPPDMPRIYLPRAAGEGAAELAAIVNGEKISVPYTGPEMHNPNNERFQQFVERVRNAPPGGWPIRTTGGFVATAWRSSGGDTFVYVENLMGPKDGTETVPGASEAVIEKVVKARPGRTHVPRSGTVSVRLDDMPEQPAVVDLCGLRPDPHRLPDTTVRVDGDFVTFDLDWKRGDARLFWITGE